MMENSLTNISERVKAIDEKVKESCVKYNRDIEDVKLMAVTKTQTIEAVNQTIFSGITLLGENRAQELNERYEGYNLKDTGAKVHFIGHLQTNKVKQIIHKVSMIHSLDRLSLAKEINQCAKKKEFKMPVLVEINIGEEQSKSGVMPSEIENFISQISQFEHLKILGLMCIPPVCHSEIEKEKYFSFIYSHFVDIRAKKIDNISMDILSMGMSNDFPLAIKHGSNIIRIGSALFGERK